MRLLAGTLSLVVLLGCGPSVATSGSASATTAETGALEEHDGTIDRAAIVEGIRRHRDEIQYCYERELPSTPGLTGDVEIEFVIAADGSVASASVRQNSFSSTSVGDCLTERFARWSFTAPEGGSVVVHYPFHFRPALSPDDPACRGCSLSEVIISAHGHASGATGPATRCLTAGGGDAPVPVDCAPSCCGLDDEL